MLLQTFVNSDKWPGYMSFGGTLERIKSVEPDSYSAGRFKVILDDGTRLDAVNPKTTIYLSPRR